MKKAFEALSRRKIPPNRLITKELARQICMLASESGRQVALLVDRRGRVAHSILGDRNHILIPDLSYMRRGHGRLRGLRCIRTARTPGLTEEDLTDLALLRLDAMASIHADEAGSPGKVEVAYLLPPGSGNKRWEVRSYHHPSQLPPTFLDEVTSLEEEIYRTVASSTNNRGGERAILVHASPLPTREAKNSLLELERLAASAGIQVDEKIHQRVPKFNPAYLMGKGKLSQILIRSLHLGSTMVIFDQELTPVQVNNVAKMMDLKVLDRTQLILDIFANQAKSRDGKLQVELAQLRYLLPRLVGKGTAMSRLMGGIGGRGPGETKLEVDRRRVKQRIGSLERQLQKMGKRRRERRKRQGRSSMTKVAIIGYTNAGKSTLLNRLSQAQVEAEDRLFATLDPTTRRLRLPSGRVVLLADTVGFIRSMPPEIVRAFKATLEELEEADCLLHLLDASSPAVRTEKETVEELLAQLGLDAIPRIVAYNKIDALDHNGLGTGQSHHHSFISARSGQGLKELLMRLDETLPASRHSDRKSRSQGRGGDRTHCEGLLGQYHSLDP